MSERQAFEAWSEDNGYSVSVLPFAGCGYAEQDTVNRWEAWQAASAGKAELLKTLQWLDNWLGEKPMTECSARIKEAIAKHSKEKEA